MPMHLRFWSPDAPGFTSENDELEKVFGIIIAATGGRGIFIYDRGGDNIEFYRYSLEKNVDFIVRLKSRYVFIWKRKITCEELAEQCPTRYSDVITFDSHGKQLRIRMLLSRCGRWSGFGKDDIDDEPDLFKFFNCDS